MIYGPHDDEDFKDLEPVLDRALSGIRTETEAIHIHTILENPGPDNYDFNTYRPNQGMNDEEVFNVLNNIPRIILDQISQNGMNGYDVDGHIFSLSNFQVQIINKFVGNKIHIELQNYEDWNACKQYLPDGSFNGSVIDRNEFFIDHLEQREVTFRNLIQSIINDDSDASFIIIRGDMHRFYFEEIRSEFEDRYEVPDYLTYGTLYQRRT